MALLSGLAIGIGADSAELSTELTKSERAVRRTRQRIGRDMNALARITATAAAAAAAALGALSVSVIRQSEETAKAARNAGLSIESYQTLAHAFELGGSSAEALTKASQGLHRNILLLADGGLTQVRVFERLGLTFEDLAALNPEAQFRLVLERLREMPNVTERSAVAQQLLGRAGKELASVLTETTATIDAQEQRFRDLGGVISDVAGRRAELFVDQFTLMSTILRNSFAEGLLTAVEAAEDLDDILFRVGEVANFVGRAVGGVVNLIVDNIDIFARIGGALIAWRLLNGLVGRLIVNVGILIFSMRSLALITLVVARAGRILRRAFALGLLIEGVLLLAQSFQALGRIIRGVLSGDIQDAAAGIREFYDNFEGRITGLVEELANLADGIEDLVIDVFINPEPVNTPVQPFDTDPTGNPDDFTNQFPDASSNLAPVPFAPGRRPERTAREAADGFFEQLKRGFFDAIREGRVERIGQVFVDTVENVILNAFAEGLSGNLVIIVETLLRSFMIRVFGSATAEGGIGGFFSSLLGFQQGGIVPGSPGSAQLVLAHAGELILNPRQQAALLAGLSGGVLVNIVNTESDRVGVDVEERNDADGQRVIDVTIAGSLQRQGVAGDLDDLFGSYGGRRQLTGR